MTVRVALLVCCSVLTVGARAALADAVPKDATVSTTAPPAPSGPSAAGDTDEIGRSKWWPSSAEAKFRPASPLGDEGAGQEASPDPSSLRPFQRGVLFLPYAGLSVPVGSHSGSYAVGHTMGTLLGAHLSRGFSLGLEVSVDFMNPGPYATETQMDYAVSPLMTSGDARRLWMIGFKLGVSNFTRSTFNQSDQEDSYSATGFVWGGTVGGFVPLGPMAVGVLVRLTYRYLSRTCEGDADGTLCHGSGYYNRGISPALGTFDFVAAALF